MSRLPEGVPADRPRLIEIEPDGPAASEYWDVFDHLRRPPQDATPTGLANAWISKLFRVDNAHLVAFFEDQKARLHRAGAEGSSDEVLCWHGTGSFPSHNIYLDRRDGFMMQYARAGQWGSGLYFAEEAAYSHIYSTRGKDSDKLQADEFELMQCTLGLGRCVEMDRDVRRRSDEVRKRCRDLRTPPYIGSTPPLYSEAIDIEDQNYEGKYDTVVGWTQVTQIVPAISASAHSLTVVGLICGGGQTDKKLPNGRWVKNELCPRSKVLLLLRLVLCPPPSRNTSRQSNT